ncbi:MAG: type IV pilin [Promethearchaeota archaeon]|nr:MAG: type IV pilin [Candidatus Lokiarchaeota archaeon]
MSLAKMILKRKKAVSPVIATILLIALTVTAAAIVYFVVVPMLQKKPELTIVNPGHVTGDNTKIRFTIQNIGSGEASLETSDFSLSYSNDTHDGAIAATDLSVLDSEDAAIDTISISSQGEVTIIYQITGGDHPRFYTGNVYTIDVSGKTIDYTY